MVLRIRYLCIKSDKSVILLIINRLYFDLFGEFFLTESREKFVSLQFKFGVKNE